VRNSDIQIQTVNLFSDNNVLQPKLIPTVMPFLKHVTFLCNQIWDSENAITDIPTHVPLLMLSGSKDELIPQRHMISLARTARLARGFTEEKQQHQQQHQQQQQQQEGANGAQQRLKVAREMGGIWWAEFDDGTHNDTCLQPGYFDEMDAFFKDVVARL
jgi:hypothetical protein